MSFAVSVVLLGAFSSVSAAADCPASVHQSALKAFPGAKVTSCKEEREHGKVQFEVKLDTKDAKKLELDISPEGAVLKTEEAIPVSSVPTLVMSAFDAKYSKTKPQRAEKQTSADGAVTYELAFQSSGKRHEATFTDAGKFVEEE